MKKELDELAASVPGGRSSVTYALNMFMLTMLRENGPIAVKPLEKFWGREVSSVLTEIVEKEGYYLDTRVRAKIWEVMKDPDVDYGQLATEIITMVEEEILEDER